MVTVTARPETSKTDQTVTWLLVGATVALGVCYAAWLSGNAQTSIIWLYWMVPTLSAAAVVPALRGDWVALTVTGIFASVVAVVGAVIGLIAFLPGGLCLLLASRYRGRPSSICLFLSVPGLLLLMAPGYFMIWPA
jgi:hypothetical protein